MLIAWSLAAIRIGVSISKLNPLPDEIHHRWDSATALLSLLKAFLILLFSFPLLTGLHITRAAIAEDSARACWQVSNSSWMLWAWPHFWPQEQLNKLSAEHFVVSSLFLAWHPYTLVCWEMLFLVSNRLLANTTTIKAKLEGRKKIWTSSKMNGKNWIKECILVN